MPRALVVGLGCLCVAGCVSVGNERLLHDETIAQITIGETTKEQVLTLLGEPESARGSQGPGAAPEMWSYTLSRSTINPLEYLLLYGLFVNGIGLPDERRDLLIFFEANGVVSSLHQQTTTYEMVSPLSRPTVTSHTWTRIRLPGERGGRVQTYEDIL